MLDLNLLQTDDVELDRELGSKSLLEFTKLSWPIVEPARRLMISWHIEAICEFLEAMTRGEFLRGVINIPPGTMKTLTTGVMWQPWVWTNVPESKWLWGSYSGVISRRDAIRSRRIIESDFYQQRWGHKVVPLKDDWSSIKFVNSMSGFRMATTVGGAATGEHVDFQGVDDPIKPLDASGSKVTSSALETCIEWWDETMSSRMVDPATCRRLVTMQRLHDADLSGHVFKAGGYEHLNLAMRAEKRCCVVFPHKCSREEDDRGETLEPLTTGFKDPREEGELLWEERFPEEVVDQRAREMGSRAASAQDQQRPMPAGGGIFKRDWIHYWRVFPRGATQFIQSWDCAFKDLDSSDYVVGQVWAVKDGCYFLVDQVRDQMSVSGTCKAILTLSSKWKKARLKLVEAKANGDAVVQLLHKKVPGLKLVEPRGGKVSRAQAVEPLWESGNVFIPDPSLAPWVHDFVEELIPFNGDPGRKDDQVDSMTQAIVHLHDKTTETYKKAMQQLGLGGLVA